MLNRTSSSRRLASAVILCGVLSAGCQAPARNRSNSTTSSTAAPQTTAPSNVLPSDSAISPAAANAVDVAVTSTSTAPEPKAPAPEAPVPIALDPGLAADSNEQQVYGADSVGPQIGTLTRLEHGDYRCYVDVTGQDGQTYKPWASYEVCTNYYQYLNQLVEFTYEQITAPNTCHDGSDRCPGAIGNGPTREELLITHIKPVTTTQAPSHPSRAGEAVYTEYRNEERSILVTSAAPWSGENGTGNFSFQRCELNDDGCDVVITGGKAACNETVCEIVWEGEVKHSISERRVDSEAIASYIRILNHHTVANNEDVTRYGETFF